MSVSSPGSHHFWARLARPYRVATGWWVLLAAALVAADYALGPYVQFAATFVIPVFLAAWYSDLRSALALAIILPLVRMTLMLTVWGQPWDPLAIVGTAAVRIGVFSLSAVVFARLAAHERELQREVEILQGILPICMHCKSIRTDAGDWESLERYISSRTETTFTHGLCPRCKEQHYPGVVERSRQRR